MLLSTAWTRESQAQAGHCLQLYLPPQYNFKSVSFVQKIYYSRLHLLRCQVHIISSLPLPHFESSFQKGRLSRDHLVAILGGFLACFLTQLGKELFTADMDIF